MGLSSPRGGLVGVSLELREKMHLLRFFRGWVARLNIFICIFVAERQYHQLTNEDKDMNKRLFLIVSLLAAICSFGRAVEYKGYAVYTSSDSTIVCYDDGKMSEKTGDEIIQLEDWGSSEDRGLDAFDTDVKAKVKKVRFDTSFTSAKFCYTSFWFEGMTKLETIEGLQNLDTSQVLEADRMFKGCKSLESLDLSVLDMSSLKSASTMFSNCSNLKTLKLFQCGDDLETMHYMFDYCTNLVSLDLNGLKTPNVTSMYNLFYCCEKLTNLDLSSFDTSNVTTMENMFSGCKSLTSIIGLNQFNTSKVVNMTSMFENCEAVKSLDLTSFDTSQVTSMSRMFEGCQSLLTPIGVSDFDTSKVTTMLSMFSGCSSLQRLDLSGFDTSNVTNMGSMFSSCKSLDSSFFIIDGFDTSNVENMGRMFEHCDRLVFLRLQTFDTGKVTSMDYMFENCNILKTICVNDGWTVEMVTSSLCMFNNCNSLVGGAGTYYNPDHLSANYAHVDGGPDNPGYLTYAEIEKYDLWVGGVQVTDLNRSNIPIAQGTAKYNKKSKLLTLNNATITATNFDNCIMNDNPYYHGGGIDGLIIDVIGECTLSAEASAILINQNTTIKGITGKLTVSSSDDAAIAVYQSTLISNVKQLKATGMKEAIVGDFGYNTKMSIRGTLDCSTLTPNLSKPIKGLYALTLTESHFADPGGEGKYWETSKFSYSTSNGGGIVFDGADYRGRVLIEPDTEPLKYRLWVGGTRVTSANKDNIGSLWGGTASFNPATHTLTLNSARIFIEDYDDGISNGAWSVQGMPDLKIVCEGTNTIETVDGYGLALYGGHTTITGSEGGSLAIGAEDKGIYLAKNSTLTMQDANVTTEAPWPIYGLENSVVNVVHSRLYAEPQSGNSAVYGPKAFNMNYCAFEKVGNINPDGLYYNDDEQILSICYQGSPYDGPILIVPTETGVVTGIGEASPLNDNGEMINDQAREWYSLDGHRVLTPQKGHIYIRGGKKVVF